MTGIRHSYRSINGVKARLIERIGNLDPNLREGLRNIKLDWFAIRNASDDKNEGGSTGNGNNGGNERNPEILIYEEIGGSFGVSAEDFINELNAIEADQIDVRINSPGGSVFDAIAIYNAIVRHPANITTYVDALAASAASIVAMAGDEVVMMVGSQLMIHDAMGGEAGNAKDMRAMAKFLDEQSDNLAGIYAVKGGEDAKYWRNLMLAETWMQSGEAVELKLADRVFERPAKTESGDPSTEDPEEEMPEAPDIEAEDSTEDSDKSIVEADVEAAMRKRHRLTNRTFKYAGREKAPNPLSIVEGWAKKEESPINDPRKLITLVESWK